LLPLSKRWVLRPRSSSPGPDLAPLLPRLIRDAGWKTDLNAEQARRLSTLVGTVLAQRGLTSRDEVEAYLTGRAPDEDNPFRLRGMNEAVTRLRQALRAREKIAVYGDYDVDGVTGTALLVETLTALGADAQPYIPHRVDEGYGLNAGSLKELAARGVKVVVTVDCGTRAVKEIAYANRLGLNVIVTDHHAVPDESVSRQQSGISGQQSGGGSLPMATAIVNPKQPGCRYPFKELAGVGLAFKLAQALLTVESRVPATPRANQPSIQPTDFLDLVALGTVADLAPLIGENRALVRQGLARLNAPQRLGVQQLIAVSGIEPGRVDAGAIGYMLGPRLNAAGRLDHALLSYRLLTSRDPVDAERLAKELDDKNRARQQLTSDTVEAARQVIIAEGADAPLLFAAHESYPQGIVGLVASRLAEEFYRPAVVVERGPEMSKGSARSIPEFNIVAALDACCDLLLKHGGHAAAAGFTIATDKLHDLRTRLIEIAARQLAGVDLRPGLDIALELSLRDADWPAAMALALLEPFGLGNPTPVFLTRGVTVSRPRLIGEEHLRLSLSGDDVTREAVAFGQSHWLDKMPERVDVAYSLEINEWMGERRLQLKVRDLRAAQ